jgi:hypothetical protein
LSSVSLIPSLTEELLKLLGREERGHLNSTALKQFQLLRVPIQIHFADAIVRNAEAPRPRVGAKIEIVALHRNQRGAVRFDDADGNVKLSGLLVRLIASDDGAVSVDQNGSTRPVLA